MWPEPDDWSDPESEVWFNLYDEWFKAFEEEDLHSYMRYLLTNFLVLSVLDWDDSWVNSWIAQELQGYKLQLLITPQSREICPKAG